MPKSGGQRVPALRFPSERGNVRADAPAPVWTADGDEAWVYGHGSLIRVRASQRVPVDTL